MNHPSLGKQQRAFVRFGAQIAVFVIALQAPLQAAFLNVDWGARATGMGGAFSAVADDSSAPLFNPAGIVQIQWNELSANYANLYSGLTLYAGNDTTRLDQSYIAFAARPLPHIGSLALSWASFNATHIYREDSLALTYARNLGDFFPVLDNALALGMNVKYLRRSVTLDSFSSNDPVFAGGDTADAGTLDIGALYKPEEGLLNGFRFALVGMNLTQPDVGFQAQDRVPVEMRLGAAYQSKDRPWLVPALDLSLRNDILGVSAGMESWLFRNTLGLRGGVNRDEVAAGLSYYQKLGTRYGLRLDYAFTVPFYVQDSGGSHRLALTLYF